MASTPEQQFDVDVLVIGGGPAGTWAALSAVHQGASVALVDKGYCGSSGVAATAGVGHWMVPPDPAQRDQAVKMRATAGGNLTDRRWQHAVLETTWERLPRLVEWGHPAREGEPHGFRFGQAPQYLRFMRSRIVRAGVKILDHSPALELLVDRDGTVGGARGWRRQQHEPWRVHASSVVLAAGGCTWKSKSLGGDVDTGDGLLMAAEVGAHFSGMEFSSYYGMVPLGTSMDKNGYYVFATFTDEDGHEIDGDVLGGRAPLLRAALDGPLYAVFDKAPAEHHGALRSFMPNFFMVTDKLGIDPFRQRFPIDFVLEGTVRGTGGVKVVDEDCWTGTAGLFAAGDNASRDMIVGSASGAGAPNAAWAVSSGTWAGNAAARHARTTPIGDRTLTGSGGLGLRPTGRRGVRDEWQDLTRAVQAEAHPIEKQYFRSDRGLRSSLAVLDGLWSDTRASLFGEGGDAIRAREAAAMLAVARWSYRSALDRTETRGMHVRTDFPDRDDAQQHRILSGGLDQVWTAVDPVAPELVDDELASAGVSS
jgi:succinate dehydrogenase/fumarate reductase flavoprotein subunit